MDTTLRFIDTQQVLNFSGLEEQEATHLKAVHEKLREGMMLAQSRYTTLDDAARQQAEASDRQILELQWRAEQQAARQAVSDVVVKKLRDWQQAHSVSAIFSSQQALAYSDQLDITEEIATALKTEQIVFARLPEVNLKETSPGESAPVDEKP